MVSAVVTGAGLSSRMISDLERNNLPIQNKLTLPLYKDKDISKTILEFTLDNVFNSNIDECILVLGHYKDEIIESLNQDYLDKVKIVENNPKDVSLSMSLYNGLKNINHEYVLCVSADQPTITSSTYKNIINSFFNSNNPKKSITFLRRREIGHLDSPLGLGMPFTVSKDLIMPYLKDGDSNLNPILRKIFDDRIQFYAVKEQFDFELVNINHYTDLEFVIKNINFQNYEL